MIRLTSERQTAETLHHLREQAGHTRNQLAAMLRTSRSTITHRDNGDRGYPLDALLKTAAVLGYDVMLVRRPTISMHSAKTGPPAPEATPDGDRAPDVPEQADHVRRYEGGER
jgi:transcriptional regulator with XRE-family HTH domain